MDAKRYVAGFVGSLLLLGGVRAQDAPLAPPPALPSVPVQGPTTLAVPQASPYASPYAPPTGAPSGGISVAPGGALVGAPVGAAQAQPSGYDVPGVSNWI